MRHKGKFNIYYTISSSIAVIFLFHFCLFLTPFKGSFIMNKVMAEVIKFYYKFYNIILNIYINLGGFKWHKN